MELVAQVSITWMSLKWLAAALVLETEWSEIWEIPLVLTIWNSDIAQGSGGTSNVAEPPLFWVAPALAPDGQGPGAGSSSDLLRSAPAPAAGNMRRLRAAPAP